MQNELKKSTSFGYKPRELISKSNSFNINNNKNYNLLEEILKNNFYSYTENNYELTNSLNEVQLSKRLNKIKNVAKDAPILNLKVLSSNYYKTGKIFKIGPFGIINQNKINNSNKEKKQNIKINNEDCNSSIIKNQSNGGIVYFGYYPNEINEQLIKEDLSLEKKNNNKMNKLNKNIKNKYKKNEKNKKNEEKKLNTNYSNNKENINHIDIQVPPMDEDKEKAPQLSSMINANPNINLNISNILENNKYGIYFYIYFNPDYMKYYIKDCGMSYGTFIKIQNEIILKDNYLINIGDTYLAISIGIKNKSFLNEQNNNELSKSKGKMISFSDSEYDNNLNLQIISKEKNYDPVNFLPTKSKIKIGRANNCEIVIDDILLSRIHCTIEYKNNIGWILRDGYNNKGNIEESMDIKVSTNGTWLYAFEDTPIHEGMILRSDNNIFRCKF